MKMRTIALAAMIGCALGAGIASAQREARPMNVQQNSAGALHAFVEKWQQRIVNENLSVADPQNWAARSLPKLASFSAERLGLAMQAGSIGELEALMVSAPVANGTSLGILSANTPGNISLNAMTRAVRKTDPATSPALYADLAFTALNPCRIYDSRPTSGGSGIWLNGGVRTVQIGPYGSYSFQGGSATSCGMTALASATGEIAAVMVAVSSFSQTGPGYLTFFSADTPDPSATVVSMFYTAGPVQTAFVVAPTDLVLDVFTDGVSRGANTHVTLDIVGYFAKPHAQNLDCVSTGQTVTSLGAGITTFFDNPACPAGYTATNTYCFTGSAGVVSDGSGVDSNVVGNPTFCAWTNTTGSAHNVVGGSMCCRVPGR